MTDPAHMLRLEAAAQIVLAREESHERANLMIGAAQVRALLSISEEMRTANLIALRNSPNSGCGWNPPAYRNVAERLGMDTSGVSDD